MVKYGKFAKFSTLFRNERKEVKGMRRLIEMVMSLIVVATTYVVVHVVIISDLFNFSKQMPPYVPAALAVITGFIFYFIAFAWRKLPFFGIEAGFTL